MSDPLKILFLSSEIAPFAKTGGLADVTGSLPKALAGLGHDVRLAMPAYAPIEAAVAGGRWGLRPLPFELQVPMARRPVPAGGFEARLPDTDVPVYFVAERNLFARDQMYGYWDDPYRFAFFSRAALDLVIAALGWRPDVVHAHDWHAAAAVQWLATSGQDDERYRALPTLFTIHNLMHQGHGSWGILDELAIRTTALREERYREVNFMARGIYHATMISTVSPTYAREVLTTEGGHGMDGLLRYRHFDVHGILNGIDYDAWNPATDRHLARNFDMRSLDLRAENKRALQARAGLPQRDDVPLVGMVTRLDWQKGLDITGHVVHLLMNGGAGDAQFVVLGSGAREYEDMFSRLAGFHRDKMAAFLTYDGQLAPLIYGGSDVFVMPSRFEPCGLGQMIAMRYGTVPVVRATGGLADTVRDAVTGFTFTDYSADDFWRALSDALYIYRVDQDAWRSIQANGMVTDFSWSMSARGYEQVYHWAISRARGW